MHSAACSIWSREMKLKVSDRPGAIQRSITPNDRILPMSARHPRRHIGTVENRNWQHETYAKYSVEQPLSCPNNRDHFKDHLIRLQLGTQIAHFSYRDGRLNDNGGLRVDLDDLGAICCRAGLQTPCLKKIFQFRVDNGALARIDIATRSSAISTETTICLCASKTALESPT